MNVTEIWNVLVQGGPVVPFLGLVGLLWLQYKDITALKIGLHDLESLFNGFQIATASTSVKKSDLDEIKKMIESQNTENKEMISRIFERLDKISSRCGTDCLAALQARAEMQHKR